MSVSPMFVSLTTPQLKSLWPRAAGAVINGTVAAWPDVARAYGLNTSLRAAHFWGQITWECGGGTELRENGHYTAAGILKVFGIGVHSAKVTEVEARDLAAKAVIDGGRALFNRVYGTGNPKMAAQLGNIGPDDGWLFRGAGALNTTGRSAFTRIGKLIGHDLIADPDLVDDPGVALWMGAAEYVDLGCLKFADADDTHTETVHINGGVNGLNGRSDLIARWKALFVGEMADT